MSSGETRKFATTVGTAFLALSGILWWRGHTGIAGACGIVGATLLVAAFVVPEKLGPAYRAWMGMAALLSRVTSPLFLGLVYFLVVTPTALILRGLGRNPLVHREDGAGFWVSRPPDQGGRSDLTRQF